jgi:hypothetical protein
MCLKIGFKVLYRSGKLKILNELDGIPRPRQKGSVRSLTCVKILSALLQKKATMPPKSCRFFLVAKGYHPWLNYFRPFRAWNLLIGQW